MVLKATEGCSPMAKIEDGIVCFCKPQMFWILHFLFSSIFNIISCDNAVLAVWSGLGTKIHFLSLKTQPEIPQVSSDFTLWKCWNTVMNSIHWLGSLLACNSTTRSCCKHVMWTWYGTHWRIVNISHMTCTNVNVSVVCRNVNGQQFFQETGLHWKPIQLQGNDKRHACHLCVTSYQHEQPRYQVLQVLDKQVHN